MSVYVCLQISGALAEKKKQIDERMKLQRDKMKQQVKIKQELEMCCILRYQFLSHCIVLLIMMV